MGTLQFKKKVLLFVVPAVVLYLMFSIYPFLQTLYYSFTNWDGFTTPVVIGFENFRKILNDEVYRTAVIRILYGQFYQLHLKLGLRW